MQFPRWKRCLGLVDMQLGVNLRHRLELGILDVIVISGHLQHANLMTAPLGSTRTCAPS